MGSDYGVHVCCFTSAAMDDLPRKAHRDPEAVLAALHEAGRLSVFDVSTNELARTIDRLAKQGRIVYEGGAYPWTKVRVPELETPAR